MTELRPAVKVLIRMLGFRARDPRPCWLVRTQSDVALIVPVFVCSYDFLQGFRRATTDEAEQLGLIVLGPLEQVPAYSYGGKRWTYEDGRCGRTIALTTAAKCGAS